MKVSVRVSRDSSWQEDAELVRACLRGDEGAWTLLIERYRRLVYSIPITLGLSREEADEVFQEVALKLLENLGSLRREASVAAWLATTARRESWRVARGASGSRSALPLDAVDEPVADAHVLSDLIRLQSEHAMALALERLGDPCAALLRALYVEEPTPPYQDIAKRIGRPIGSLGPTRARCLSKLEREYRRIAGDAS